MQIGSCWSKKTQDGGKYLSCVIQIPFLGELNFAIFPAKEKKSENSPDYAIVWSMRRKEATPAGKVEEKFNSPFDDDPLPF